jgi:hypothetical protein
LLNEVTNSIIKSNTNCIVYCYKAALNIEKRRLILSVHLNIYLLIKVATGETCYFEFSIYCIETIWTESR